MNAIGFWPEMNWKNVKQPSEDTGWASSSYRATDLIGWSLLALDETGMATNHVLGKYKYEYYILIIYPYRQYRCRSRNFHSATSYETKRLTLSWSIGHLSSLEHGLRDAFPRCGKAPYIACAESLALPCMVSFRNVLLGLLKPYSPRIRLYRGASSPL